MDSIISYQIFYTESAARDIEEKFDYIARQLRDPGLAQAWYLRLRATIQDALTTFPCKYACYDAAPWKGKGIRLFFYGMMLSSTLWMKPRKRFPFTACVRVAVICPLI